MATETKRETRTWWRAHRLASDGRITAHEVIHATAKTVTYLTNGEPLKAHKDTTWDMWFDNERGAVEFQRTRLAKEAERLDGMLRRAESALAAFNDAHPLPDTEV